MAVYKVPQDVEAEDKLIGPFSFRQFIYLIVAALGMFMAWLLAQIFIGLIIIPLPVIVAFLALALPLRKDQPMETYLIAMIKFFFKPRRRVWDPEGTISLLQITAPKTVDGPQLKGFGGNEASQQLAYLAQVVDTQGWSTRGATSASDNMSDIFVAEASHAEDVLDESSGVVQAFNQRIAQSDEARRQAVINQMQATVSNSQAAAQATAPQTPPPTPVASPLSASAVTAPPAAPPEEPTNTDLHYNPYPDAIHQHVVDPAYEQQNPTPVPTPQPQAQSQPSSDTVSPDIMRLANNNDLSISALANEAHRLENNDEVVVSLR